MSVLDAPTTSARMLRSSEEAERLVVAWQHPIERKISPVGFLTYDGSTYRFAYIKNALRVKDFRPLLGFPNLRGSYSSDELFPLFAQRAMEPRRPDYQRYVERLGLAGEPGPWEQISRSQGRRQGDTLQLLPEPTLDNGTLTSLFLVHGMRHAHEDLHVLADREVRVTRGQVEGALRRLKAGDELLLAREPGNRHNPLALMVVEAAVPVGWVPDLLVEDLQRLMRSAHVQVLVEHVNGPDAPWHMRLLVRLRATSAGDFRFFTGEQWAPLAR